MAAGCSESSSWQGHGGDYRRCQTQIRARKKNHLCSQEKFGQGLQALYSHGGGWEEAVSECTGCPGTWVACVLHSHDTSLNLSGIPAQDGDGPQHVTFPSVPRFRGNCK